MLTIMFVVVSLLFGRGGWKPPWSGARSDTALAILKKRYARGEISTEEFEQVKNDLVA